MRGFALALCTLVGCGSSAPDTRPPVPPAPTATGTTTAADLTPHETTLELDDVTLFVRIVGPRTATTTIVALHGGPGISHEYMRNFDVLASDRVRVVTYDQRGTGKTTMPKSGKLEFAEQARDLEALRQSLGSQTKLDLIGHSYGGLLEMAYVEQFSSNVRSLIFVDSMPPKYEGYAIGQALFGNHMRDDAKAGAIQLPLPDLEGDDCSKQLTALLPVYFYDKKHPMTKHLAGSKCQNAIGDATREANGMFDYTDTLGRVVVPTLVVQGEADPFEPRMAEWVVAALALAKPQYELLDKCGHVPFEECPDRFYPIVKKFLAARP